MVEEKLKERETFQINKLTKRKDMSDYKPLEFQKNMIKDCVEMVKDELGITITEKEGEQLTRELTDDFNSPSHLYTISPKDLKEKVAILKKPVKTFESFKLGKSIDETLNYADQRKMQQDFDNKNSNLEFPKDKAKIVAILADAAKDLQAQSQSNDWEKFYMSPFYTPDARILQKKGDFLSTEKIMIADVEKYLRDKKLTALKDLSIKGEAHLAFTRLGIDFLKWFKNMHEPIKNIEETLKIIKQATGLSHNSKPIYISSEGYTIYGNRNDADWRGTAPKGSVVRGTNGDSVSWVIELKNGKPEMRCTKNNDASEKAIIEKIEKALDIKVVEDNEW